MKGRHLLLAAGLVAAGWLASFGENSSGPQIAQPLSRAEGRQAITDGMGVDNAAGRQTSAPKGQAQILALHRRAQLIVGDETEEDGERLFAVKVWQPPRPPAPAKAEPQAAPTAPPLPFTYLGKQLSDGRLEVYLARGDRVFTARNQSVIEGAYRVESIEPPTLSLLYLPLNQIQKLAIGVLD